MTKQKEGNTFKVFTIVLLLIIILSGLVYIKITGMPVKNPSASNCVDTDDLGPSINKGINPTQAGEVLIGGISKGKDICLNENTLREYYCGPSRIFGLVKKVSANYKDLKCKSDQECRDGACRDKVVEEERKDDNYFTVDLSLFDDDLLPEIKARAYHDAKVLESKYFRYRNENSLPDVYFDQQEGQKAPMGIFQYLGNRWVAMTEFKKEEWKLYDKYGVLYKVSDLELKELLAKANGVWEQQVKDEMPWYAQYYKKDNSASDSSPIDALSISPIDDSMKNYPQNYDITNLSDSKCIGDDTFSFPKPKMIALNGKAINYPGEVSYFVVSSVAYLSEGDSAGNYRKPKCYSFIKIVNKYTSKDKKEQKTIQKNKVKAITSYIEKQEYFEYKSCFKNSVKGRKYFNSPNRLNIAKLQTSSSVNMPSPLTLFDQFNTGSSNYKFESLRNEAYQGWYEVSKIDEAPIGNKNSEILRYDADFTQCTYSPQKSESYEDLIKSIYSFFDSGPNICCFCVRQIEDKLSSSFTARCNDFFKGLPVPGGIPHPKCDLTEIIDAKKTLKKTEDGRFINWLDYDFKNVTQKKDECSETHWYIATHGTNKSICEGIIPSIFEVCEVNVNTIGTDACKTFERLDEAMDAIATYIKEKKLQGIKVKLRGPVSNGIVRDDCTVYIKYELTDEGFISEWDNCPKEGKLCSPPGTFKCLSEGIQKTINCCANGQAEGFAPLGAWSSPDKPCNSYKVCNKDLDCPLSPSVDGMCSKGICYEGHCNWDSYHPINCASI